MAQIITCDGHGGAHPADWLLTRLTDGEVQAYCDSAFLEFVTMAATAAATNEADGADQEAIDRLESVGQDSAPDDEMIQAGQAQAAQEDAQEPELETDPAHVIRKGQSTRARAHQARQAAAEATDQGAAQAAVMEAPAGPDDDEDDDEDDAPTP